MPRIQYIDRDFRGDALQIIDDANRIISAYAADGYDLTLRQLYYQFVTENLIANKQSEYKRLGSVINDARLAGKIDWLSIVDRTRNLRGGSHWATPGDVIESAALGYAIDKWKDQDYRVEVWIEKDALVGVLQRACPAEDVNYFSCRGYTSQSEIWMAARRIGRYIETGQRVLIVHLGDHDPSGIDMTRDITERLTMFLAIDQFGGGTGDSPEGYADDVGNWLTVNRVALNMDQIRRYQPPPNPAKLSDARAAGYVRKHGYDSWELDALPPNVLVQLIRDAIGHVRDASEWDAAKARESSERRVLTAASKNWPLVAEHLEANGLVLEAGPDDDDYLDDPEEN